MYFPFDAAFRHEKGQAEGQSRDKSVHGNKGNGRRHAKGQGGMAADGAALKVASPVFPLVKLRAHGQDQDDNNGHEGQVGPGVFNSHQDHVGKGNDPVEKKQVARHRRVDPCEQDGAGAYVFDEFRHGMVFLGHHVHGALDGRVEKLRNDDEGDGKEQGDKFDAGQIKQKAEGDNPQRRRVMKFHVSLRMNGADDALYGKVK